jgi:hypothetical protein
VRLTSQPMTNKKILLEKEAFLNIITKRSKNFSKDFIKKMFKARIGLRLNKIRHFLSSENAHLVHKF